MTGYRIGGSRLEVQDVSVTTPAEAGAVGVASGRRYRWVVLAVGTFGIFAALGLARFGYSTLLPSMQQDLRIDNTAVGAIASANLIGYLLLSAIGGALASRFGSRAVAVVGLALVAVSGVLTGVAGSLGSICFWRAMTGLGSGAANMAIMGLWPAWFEPRLRGRAAGVAVAGSSWALMLTGLGVPRILDGVPDGGWRLCWYLFGSAAALAAVLGWVFLRNRPSEAAGAVTMSSGTPSWSNIYRSRVVWHLGAVYTAFGFSYIIYMTFFVKSLVAEHGYGSVEAGNLFMIIGACSMVCGFIWGMFSDILGRRAGLVTVYLLQTAAFALFGFSHSSGLLVLSAVLFGLTAWSIPAIIAAACGDILGCRLAAAGLGFVTIFMGVGQVLGPSVAGAVADTTGSFSLAFILAAAVALAGGLGSLFLPSTMLKDG